MRTPFRKDPPALEPEPPVIDETVFDRWLRAHRPPLDWFAELTPGQQEVFAERGDLYAEDILVATGFAVQDPEGTRLGLAAIQGDEDAEAELTIRKAAELAARVVGAQRSQIAPEPTPALPPLSMGGLGERRQAADQERQDSNPAPTLLGVVGKPVEPEELAG